MSVYSDLDAMDRGSLIHLFLKNQLKIFQEQRNSGHQEQTKASKAEKKLRKQAKSDSKETKVQSREKKKEDKVIGSN
jgi:sortase (surface protein transpeptidase)